MKIKLLIAISVLSVNGIAFATDYSSYYLDKMPDSICEGEVAATGQSYVSFVEQHYKPAYRQTQYNGIARSQKAVGCAVTVPQRLDRD